MKLIQEYIIKIIILVFVLVLLMEGFILYLLLVKSRKVFINAYQQTITKSETKSIDITRKIGDYINYLILKYITELKLVGKHALLLNGKQIYNPEKTIHRESNIFINNDKQKNIINATIEDIIKNDNFKDLFNESSRIFDYISKFQKQFKNINDENEIIKDLLLNQELNTVAYYSPSNKNPKDLISIKFIVSILKTIYIKRYISKKERMDYIRFLIINQDELYIYPPEAYNQTCLYNFRNIYYFPYSDCVYSSEKKNQQFPLCIYNYINEKLIVKDGNHITLIFEEFYYKKIVSAICLKIPFLKNEFNQAILCLEIDFSSFFNSANFNNPEKYEFGIFIYDSALIIPIFYNRKNIYDELHIIFNDTVSEQFLLNKKINDGIYSLFHFLYYNLTKIAKENQELNINITEIEEEFKSINDNILLNIGNYNKNKTNDQIILSFNKTICEKSLLGNNYECFKDEFEMIIIPLNITVKAINDDFLETVDSTNNNFNMYSYSIISMNPISNKGKISTLLRIKALRTIILFYFFTIIILIFFLILLNLFSEFSFKPINKIINQLEKININNESTKFCALEEQKIIIPNKQMFELTNIYKTMRNTLIIKQVFNQENFLDKYNLEFHNLVKEIDKRNIKEICNSFLGFYHFQNNAYNLAEKEFSSAISFIEDNLNTVTGGKNSEYEDKIKDAIKRSSTVSYINEYFEFEKIEEHLLTIINLNIFKQRFMYLYAMTEFKLGNELNINNNNSNINQTNLVNKNKYQKEKEKKMNYYKEAIKLFKECKNINTLLGINKLKIIYCLIMISKSYIQLNDYKHAINNINEALSLFFEFSRSFKDYHYKNYNPKIMLFIENNIFHYILFTIECICHSFNRPFACNWIILKIFETSPFLIGNVHNNSAIFILNYLEKNKLKLNKLDSKFLKSNILLKEYEKNKKYFSKIVSRMNVKNKNVKFRNDKSVDGSIYSTSYKNKTESIPDKSIYSTTFKREMVTGKISTYFHNKNKNIDKIITLCLSEKILEKVNGLELKDVIIKYFQKYFATNENDKFSFFQFANNGKKTICFKMEQLDYFLLKIQKTNNAFGLRDSFKTNLNLPFMELYNLFDSIIKNYPSSEDNITDNITDNIIIMFINSDDIRFTSISECLNIVEELNKKNVSVYLLSYDKEIKRDKINNIFSFLNGLFEGYFFQIKNYQQLKQIFINISTIKYQSNFFGYDFNSLDNEL